eukprot:TRINITY_DN3176_c0_g1_i3.p1 TRINITY_DN3176_c0_g1~~TRINITY_DN3176_c0_g1_i3.p1  ORF type:complete len:214 (+),score=72.84 TRINITY_DN3176_c0_g1_i3:66-707(+)
MCIRDRYLRDSGARVGTTVTTTTVSDLDNAKAIARRIFDTYDRDRNGVIDPHEIPAMMSDAYKTINKAFTPSKADVDSYIKVLDRDNDGRVTLPDIEQVVIRFLLGEDYGRYSVKDVVRTQAVYPAVVQQQLDQARRIFQQYDRDRSGYIDEAEIYPMMRDTYKAMGVNFEPSPSDVQSYMRMTDLNRDGRISLAEYEALVIRSLEALSLIHI